MRSLTAHGWETDQPKSATAPHTFRSYDNLVPTGLKRYGSQGHDHHVTFSCYGRRPYLDNDEARITFLDTLEQLRQRHNFYVFGYMVMPEHVHLLLSEPDNTRLATALNVLKTQSARHLKAGREQFWQTRYHDVNLLTHRV